MKTPHTVPAALAIAFALALFAPGMAGAQYTSSMGVNFNNPGSALLGTMIANRAIADAARKASSAAAAGTSAVPSKPASREAAARLTFRPVAKRLMVTELAATLVKTPDAQRQLAAAFEGYLQNFDDQARKDREPANDVGRAAAFFVMVNYFAATGKEPTDAQADGAQAIFRAGLADSEPFARMGDRDRQRLYESLVILGTFPMAGVSQALEAKDQNQQQMFRAFAADLVKALIGVPVERIRLTKAGFRIDE